MKLPTISLMAFVSVLTTPGCSRHDVTGHYVEKAGEKISVRWRFNSDGTVQRVHRDKHGQVMLPGKWKVTGGVVVVDFHPRHAEQGLVPPEMSFGVLPDGNLAGLGEARGTMLEKRRSKSKSR